jgi:hypothetical protein
VCCTSVGQFGETGCDELGLRMRSAHISLSYRSVSYILTTFQPDLGKGDDKLYSTAHVADQIAVMYPYAAAF